MKKGGRAPFLSAPSNDLVMEHDEEIIGSIECFIQPILVNTYRNYRCPQCMSEDGRIVDDGNVEDARRGWSSSIYCGECGYELVVIADAFLGGSKRPNGISVLEITDDVRNPFHLHYFGTMRGQHRKGWAKRLR